MLVNVETVVAELNALKAYRQEKFHALSYLVKIDDNKKQKEESVIHKEHCDFLKWLDKENRREELVVLLGEKIVDELCTLHELWYEDYMKIFQHYNKGGLLSNFFAFKSEAVSDKIASYFSDLKMTNERCDHKMEHMAVQLKTMAYHR